MADMSTLITDIFSHPGEAFRGLVPMALIGAVALAVLHLILCLIGRRPAERKSRWNWWEMLVYLGTTVSVAILGVTAFFAVIRFGALEDWLLFAHMFGAGAFVVALPVLAITWCEANRFGRRAASDEAASVAPRFFWLPKVMFWLILVSGLAVSATMLLSMLPLFGTEDLHCLLDIHRYSGLVVVVAMVFHLYSVVLQRVGLR